MTERLMEKLFKKTKHVELILKLALNKTLLRIQRQAVVKVESSRTKCSGLLLQLMMIVMMIMVLVMMLVMMMVIASSLFSKLQLLLILLFIVVVVNAVQIVR